MYEVDENGISDFRRDIECIIDLTKIKLFVSTGLSANSRLKKTGYLSCFVHRWQKSNLKKADGLSDQQWTPEKGRRTGGDRY